MHALIPGPVVADGTAGETRTMYVILYPQHLQSEVVDILDGCGVPGFSETARVTGRGPRGRHFNTQVWPGADGMIFTVLGAQEGDALIAALATFSTALEQQSQGLYGLHVFTWRCRQPI